MFLFDEIANLRKWNDAAYKELPNYIEDNLNPKFQLRPYQVDAFRNFITYYESGKRENPTQLLYHMATGSGKTLIMAGLILYLYKQGYRNFLFFVNLDNIVQKTKDNFLNITSGKYLFAEEIRIDGEIVKIAEVKNFQGVAPDTINICFTTIQGLFSDIWTVKEGSTTLDDYKEQKTVLISDEAHHINVDTKKGRTASDEDLSKTWEYTVQKLFKLSPDNILLEFTATCDLKNPFILREYESKIIYDYPLRNYREHRYSKQVKAIRADIDRTDRALLALMFSQYRMKIFQDNRLYIKPVVLFKAKTIAESKEFEQSFYDMIHALDGGTLELIVNASPLDEVKRMAKYFEDSGFGFDELAHQLKDEFGPPRCLSVNDEKEATARQIILNSLENADNPYRALFAVKKLDEGWDVLNLFDIVRLYETRDVKLGKPGATTIAEAQLIGRGARYCPFITDESQDKFKRKFDNDINNPLRVCEELYYHCQYDSRYINELNKVLIDTGIMPDNQIEINYLIKDTFKSEELYTKGVVLVNSREVVSRKNVTEIIDSIRNSEHTVSAHTGKAVVDTLMDTIGGDSQISAHTQSFTIGQLAKNNYSLIHCALRKFDVFKFNVLLRYFPNLASLREFTGSHAYLGNVRINFESLDKSINQKYLLYGLVEVFGKLAGEFSSIQDIYRGTEEFIGKPFKDVFRDKTLHITGASGVGEGISQYSPDMPPDLRLNLQDLDWFVYKDNFGTEDEKRFVAYFAGKIDQFKQTYQKVFLVRNERQLAIYSFDEGRRFEPDYLLFLRKNKNSGFVQYQVFIEPKGKHLVKEDEWKEKFLLGIKDRAEAVTLANDAQYHVIGLPFYSHGNNDILRKFTDALLNLAPSP